jgi:V/A-type H+-transporting ATPase subunit E
MDEKLKELTEIIVKEGVDKAAEQSRTIKDQAQQDANEILHRARREADDTIALAQKRAEEIRSNAESELKLASQQILSNLKQQITDLLLIKVLEKPINTLFKDTDFMGQLIIETARTWNAQTTDTVDLEVLVTKARYQEIEKYLQQKAPDILQAGLKVDIDKQLPGGFQISPRGENFKLNFSETEFIEFFKTFLRTKTQKLLFEGK